MENSSWLDNHSWPQAKLIVDQIPPPESVEIPFALTIEEVIEAELEYQECGGEA